MSTIRPRIHIIGLSIVTSVIILSLFHVLGIRDMSYLWGREQKHTLICPDILIFEPSSGVRIYADGTVFPGIDVYLIPCFEEESSQVISEELRREMIADISNLISEFVTTERVSFDADLNWLAMRMVEVIEEYEGREGIVFIDYQLVIEEISSPDSSPGARA